MRGLNKINIKKAVTHNLLLKIGALIIAAIIWYYVSGEITKGIKI